MSLLEQLIAKKKQEGKTLNPMESDAKMSMLKALKEAMTGVMKDDLASGKMKKVEIASDNTDGLKEGLDKAKDMLGSDEGMEDESSEEDADDESLEALMGKYLENPTDEAKQAIKEYLDKPEMI